MFGWEFPPFISGGLGTACHGLSRGLVSNGVEVTFVVPTMRRMSVEALSGIRIVAADEVAVSAELEKALRRSEVRLKSRFSVPGALSPYHTVESFKEMTSRFSRVQAGLGGAERLSVLDFTGNYGRDLWAEVSRYGLIGELLGLSEEFDVVHAHDWLTYFAGVNAKRVSGKPLVVHVHATEFDRSGEHVNQGVYDIERFGMAEADRVVAVSYYTKNVLVKRYGVDPSKVEVVHNAVDKACQLSRYGIKRGLKEKVVLFLGRVTMQKGPDYFLQSAALVLKRLRNVRFVMAGSGDMLPRMINWMAGLRIADRFHFTGFLRGVDVERMYAMSDLYVMPSVSEPFGITPFEALLYDVPIIISRQSGVGEVLRNAVKVDFWDVHKLADQMIRLLTDERYARAVVEHCREELQSIEWDTAGSRVRDIYQGPKTWMASGGKATEMRAPFLTPYSSISCLER
jgi:glycosyltransferase involved in cell wall biosynthesis